MTADHGLIKGKQFYSEDKVVSWSPTLQGIFHSQRPSLSVIEDT